MRQLSWWAIGLSLSGGMLAVTACATPTPSAPSSATSVAPGAPTANPAARTPIRLGVMADVSGPFAPQGAEMRINTDLAVKQWNDTGGVDGRPIEAMFADPKSDAARALDAATQFVQRDHVDVLVGAVGSNECAAIEELALKLQVLYITSSGCAAEEITAKTCNRYTFRFVPQGRQAQVPLARYLVSEVGANWGLLYPDYAFGQSTLAAFGAGLQEAGGTLSAPIAVPLTETNLTPYVTKVPADGSIVGIYDSLTGGQQTSSVTVMQQFGISQHLRLVVAGGKESFGGIYPDILTGAIFNSFSPEAKDQFMLDYEQVFRQMAQVDADVANIIGGADHAKPGSQMGYSAFAAMSALKQSMRAVHYAGPADTPKLIDALAHFKSSQSADFPGGDVMMDPNDHQGRMTQYVSQIDGQNEKILLTIPVDQVPPIGSCKV